MEPYNPLLNPKYKLHQIFEDLDLFINFYEMLSFGIYSWVSSGTKWPFNFNAPMFSSMQGTLHSIKLILQEGRINDANSLLRRYYDSVIINVYAELYIKNNLNFENYLVTKINDWLTGKEKLPEYRILNNYVLNSSELKDVNALLIMDKRYKQIRERCNDHTHYNLFYYMLINDNKIYDSNRIKFLDIISNDIKDLFIMHFAYMFYLNPHFMTSDDYTDYLSVGQTPPEDFTFSESVLNENMNGYRLIISPDKHKKMSKYFPPVVGVITAPHSSHHTYQSIYVPCNA